MATKLSLLHPAKLIGTWFGVGLVPRASGTAGSIAALPFAYLIQAYTNNLVLLIASVFAFLAGWLACTVYLRHTDAKDPKEIVIDEVAAQWFLLSVLPPTFISYAVALVLFRFFDILKPWPVSLADRYVPGALGVMIDDMIAAVYPIFLLLVVLVVSRLAGHPVDLSQIMGMLSGKYVF